MSRPRAWTGAGQGQAGAGTGAAQGAGAEAIRRAMAGELYMLLAISSYSNTLSMTMTMNTYSNTLTILLFEENKLKYVLLPQQPAQL